MKIYKVLILGKDTSHYFISKDDKKLDKETVVVQTREGMFLGKVLKEIFPSKKEKNYDLIFRKATEKDFDKYFQNEQDSAKDEKEIKQIVTRKKLPIRILKVMYSLNKEKMTIIFFSEKRIDFRDLLRDLRKKYSSNIELKQVGIRDKAKEINGYGFCGQKLCCSRFIKEFDSISINMAKNQNLALNPNIINGVCGRLLCCLKYEDDLYTSLKKEFPKIGEIVNSKLGKGKVTNISLLTNKIKLDIKNDVVEVDLSEIIK